MNMFGVRLAIFQVKQPSSVVAVTEYLRSLFAWLASRRASRERERPELSDMPLTVTELRSLTLPARQRLADPARADQLRQLAGLFD